MDKLLKKNEGFHKDIEKAKEEILKAENSVQQNLKDQEMKRAEIEGQKEVRDMIQKKLQSVGKE